jgi:predicted secreted protein with PEFG-CTERM motif
MKPKYNRVFIGLIALVAILSAASEITIMTASAQIDPTHHCTTSQPCVAICGDHVCAPGEYAKMQSTLAQLQRNNSGTTAMSTNSTTPTLSYGVVVGGVVSYQDIASDGTQVVVRTGHPISGQPLDIGIAFKDVNNNFVQHQNYAITVMQDGKSVFSNTAGHTHSGTDTQTTYALTSSNPVNIEITLNGVGLPTADPSTWTGPKGEVLDFAQATDVKTPSTPITNMTAAPDNATVPEFGPVASIVLAIAVLSIVVFAAKTRVIPKL